MMELSEFGNRFCGKIGISELMDDLGKALNGDHPMLMLGGGNPSHIPAVQALFRERMTHILATPGEFEQVIGNYDTPQGARLFIEALAERFRQDFGWDISPANIALTNGSQNRLTLALTGFQNVPVFVSTICLGVRYKTRLPSVRIFSSLPARQQPRPTRSADFYSETKTR